MKFKTYRILDLTILVVLTFIIEMVATYCVNGFFHGIRPFPVIGMLMTLIAIARWGVWGIIIIPVSVLANFFTGRFLIGVPSYRETYDIVSTVFSFISTSSILISFLWFKKYGRKKVFKDHYMLYTLIATAIGINLLLSVLFSSINYFYQDISNIASDIGSRIIGMILYNSGSYIVLLIFTPLLAKQDVLADVKTTLIEKKKEAKNESLYYSKKQDDEKK